MDGPWQACRDFSQLFGELPSSFAVSVHQFFNQSGQDVKSEDPTYNFYTSWSRSIPLRPRHHGLAGEGRPGERKSLEN